MAYRNQCSFLGNIGKDVDVKTFENGGKLGNTSLAITKKFKDKNDQLQEKTTWINLTFPASMVDNAVKLVTKGKQVIVDGELETREYEKEGVKHSTFSIRVTGFQLLGAKKPGEADGAADESAE